MKRLLSVFLLLLIVGLTVIAYADSWVAPHPRIFASWYQDRAFKTVPHGEKDKGTLLRLDKEGNFVTIWETMLVNIPATVLIASRGGVVTLDTYSAMGHDHVIVIYGPKGDVRADYKLDDLFDAKERRHMSGSVSSIYWREDREIKIAFVGRKEILIVRPNRPKIGREMRFDLETGKVSYRPNPHDAPQPPRPRP